MTELVIDGMSANHGRRRLACSSTALSIVAKRTNILPFTIWMPVLDTANTVHIQSPTRQETVITTPHIPGLELHLPAGTVITDEDWRIGREVSITPIPGDRPALPAAEWCAGADLFIIQPGACVEVVGSTGRGSGARTRGDAHSAAGYGSYSRGAFLVYPARCDRDRPRSRR